MPIRVKTMGHKMIQMKRWSEAKIQNKAKLKKELLEAMKKEHPINRYKYLLILIYILKQKET